MKPSGPVMERGGHPGKTASLTPEQQGGIRAHLQKVLASAPFAQSQRSRSFLEYVVEESLSGHAEEIKERNIAVDVFGKSTDFNPQEESTVRVAAGDVRKRLRVAYQAGFGDGVQIQLPVGTYCPNFHFDQEGTGSPLNADPTSVIVERHLRPAQLWASGVAIAATLAFALFLAMRPTQQPLDCVWDAFSGYKQPVMLVLPTPPVFVARNPERWSAASNGQSLLLSDLNSNVGSYTGVGAGLGAARFAEQLAKRNQQFTLRFGKSVSYAEVQQSPSILFGSTSSGIGMQMTNSLRFRIVDGSKGSSIVDSKESNRAWAVSKELPPDAQREGYALITFIRKTESGFPLMVIAGLSPADTQAGAQFLTDSTALLAFAQVAAERWANRNFQVVLHENIYEGSPDRPTITSWQTW